LNAKTRPLYDINFSDFFKEEMQQQQVKKSAAVHDDKDMSIIKASAFGAFFNLVNNKQKLRELKGITQEMFLKILMNPPMYKHGNPIDSKIRSVCLVLEGSCTVVNSQDNFHIFELRQGNHFGCSDLLKIIDCEFLGDIMAGERGARILVIPSPD